MSERDPALRQAVDRSMQNAQDLENLFAENYQNEANRPKLVSGVGQEGFAIQRNLNALMKTVLKSGLDPSNKIYNQFISTWNNGTGDLGRSFFQINAFWTSLQGRRPQLDNLMVLSSPDTGPQPTSADITIAKQLRSQSNELVEVFRTCVASHTAPLAAKIKEHVRVITELLNNSNLSQHAQTVLTNSKKERALFTSLYKNGTAIDNRSLSALMVYVS